MKILVSSLGAFLIAALGGGQTLNATTSCERLASLTLPDTTITRAEVVPAGAFSRSAIGRGSAGQAFSNPVPFCRVADQYRFVVFKDPNWDWRTFNLDRDLALADKVDGGTINAIDPNIRPFTQRGGKLLMYHGWADQLVGPGTSINYYNSVVKALGGESATTGAVRLFMAPGMGHCGGGEGPNTFDTINALEQWVEHGKAPAEIIASHATNGVVDRTRPLCPYPRLATYKGTGDTEEAANFVCKAR